MTEKIKLDGIEEGARIAVAMSGGVDSSVTAALMVEAGYDVVGITLQLYDYGQAAKKGACCAGQDIYDAKTVADKLNFPHYVLDYESIFKQSVIDDFIDSYTQGETPIPCIRCNQRIKFQDLLTTARKLEAQALVTGHYVRRLPGSQGAELHRAVDSTRDQSYFLFATTQNQLDYLRFPLGGMMAKSETRQHARRFGLEIADKPDSQDICFVPNGDYAAVIEKFRPGTLESGEIVHIDGSVLGRHEGIINYTVGQRRGLGIAAKDPLYVIRLEPKTHRVIVGPHEALAKTSVWVKEVNWLELDQDFTNGLEVDVKLRSTHAPTPAILYRRAGNCAEVVLAQPEYGISGGQACVFFKGSRVLGGGWITAHPS